MYRTVAIGFILLLQGCAVTSEPDQDSQYSYLDSLDSVAGCYQNRGERPAGSAARYLSQIFWPELATPHELIQSIEVTPASARSVLISGLSEGKPLIENEFFDGQHFTFESGKIRVTNKLFGSLAYPAGNPFIGAGHTSVTLGIDQSGDGKSTEATSFAGTAFLFIPVAGQVSDSVRFVRLGSTCEKN